MQYEEARFFLSQTAGRGIELGLDRMRSFMKELGDPQEKTACQCAGRKWQYRRTVLFTLGF